MEIEAGGSADALNRSSQAAEPLSPMLIFQLTLSVLSWYYRTIAVLRQERRNAV